MALCLNGEEFERVITREPCECTMVDYECDFGYSRDFTSNGDCKLEVDAEKWRDSFEDRKTEQCEEYGYYEVSQGYRLVPGDICQGGKQLQPNFYSCSAVGTLGQFFTSVTGFIVLVAFAVFLYLLSIANMHVVCKKIPLINTIPKLLAKCKKPK